jgi:hypothetical protein
MQPATSATAAAGVNSPPLELDANAYNSSSSSSVYQKFAWETQAADNDTSTPMGNLALLFGVGSGTLNSTGLSIAQTGQITFASGQTFPGTGAGTITGITTTSPLTGSGTSGSVALGINQTALVTDITPALETTFNGIYPQLDAADNIFTGEVQASQTIGAGNAAVVGNGTNGSVGVAGQSDTGYGVWGISTTNSGGYFTNSSSTSPALYASNSANSTGAGDNPTAISGIASGTNSTGVFSSATQAGVVADVNGASAAAGAYAFYGAASNGNGAVFYNSSVQYPTIYANNLIAGSSGNNPFVLAASTSGAYAYNVYATAGGLESRGVDSDATGNGSIGVYGESDGAVDSGTGNAPIGVKGLVTGKDGNGVVADATGSGGYGLYAHASGASDTMRGSPAGVYALANNGYGVIGVSASASSIGTGYADGSGVWGDMGNDNIALAAVMGTADGGSAGWFVNNSPGSPSNPALEAINFSTGLDSIVFEAGGNEGNAGVPEDNCIIYGSGDLDCTGTVSAVVAADSGRRVETYSVQSTENWIEDFGSGTLERGVAVVKIDPTFAETVSATADYHVFLTPRGDSAGLYVINATPTSFEVRESKGGTSSLAFDYRIVAKRRGYEAQRLTDVTERFNAQRAQMKRRTPAAGAAASKAEVEAHMVEPQPAVTQPAPRLYGHPGGGQAPSVLPVHPPTRPTTHSEPANHPDPVAHP